MNRVTMPDGRWFDADAAAEFDEASRWDGKNYIPVPSGSEWDHQRLYKTASGNWVLNRWSSGRGSLESYEEISEEAAYRWLVLNEHFDAVPAEHLESLKV